MHMRACVLYMGVLPVEIIVRGCVHVDVYTCVRACVRARVCACVCEHVRACVGLPVCIYYTSMRVC
jgi:hypothetical protein